MIIRKLNALFSRLGALIYRRLLPNSPSGFQKAVLANHPSPEIRRLALISLGAQVSDSCHLNQGVRVVMDSPQSANIVIGDRVAVAPNVQFVCNSGPHPQSILNDIPYVRDRLIKEGKITIGSDVWIGAGAIILPGVRIGKCCIIGAASLVVEHVPEYSVVAGLPARKIRDLGNAPASIGR